MAKSNRTSKSDAAHTAWSYGTKLGLITVPLMIIGSGSSKKVQPFAKYRHLNGKEFSEEVFEELWRDHLDAPGLGIWSPNIIEIEADSPEGVKALSRLKFPRTPTYQSKRGIKYLFKAPEEEIATNKQADGLLGEGTEVLNKLLIVPPTPGYEWLDHQSLLEVPPAPIPKKVLARLMIKKSGPEPSEKLDGTIPSGQRHDRLLSIAGAMRRKGSW